MSYRQQITRRRRAGIALVASVLVSFVSAAAHAEPSANTDPSTGAELDAAYALKAEGRYVEAESAFRRALDKGASRQLVALELGYIATAKHDSTSARRYYEQAADGDDTSWAERARLELKALAPPPAPAPPATPTPPPPAPPAPGQAALADAYRAKASGDLPRAVIAFRRAKSAGAEPQRVAMELGYIATASGQPDEAYVQFGEAERGPDAVMGAQARRERAALPKYVHADILAEAFGWNRVSGPTNGNAVVPTMRVRAFYRPSLSFPLEFYLSAQATRDSASRGFVGGAPPLIYSDNYATFGLGARVKLWKALELFGQAGPAVNLLDDGRDRTTLDVRGGALLYVETARCAPAPERTARAGFWPCLETYAEGVYASRFRDNVIAFARPRAAAGYLVTGPVLWQATAEARVGKDINDDYWNNFVDGGLGHRWRLLAPFRLDVLLTANAGTYFGLASRDPAPSRLGYVDARAQISTFVEF